MVILLVGTGEPLPYCNKNTLGKIASKFGIGRPPPPSVGTKDQIFRQIQFEGSPNGSSLCNSQCVSFSKVARPAQSVTFSDCCVVFLFPNKCLYSPTIIYISHQMFIFAINCLNFPTNVYISQQMFIFPIKCL